MSTLTSPAPTESASDSTSCRLCGAPTVEAFSHRLLNRHTVRYFRCSRCSSLQTEPPHWLGEAYARNLSALDTGAVQRNLRNLGVAYAVCRFFQLKNAIDHGGGDGVLCRMLRDHDINCFVRDRYASPAYAEGFTEPDFATPDLMMAFEVIEHLADPSKELDVLFGCDAKVVLVSTGVYEGQGADWWYLAPESGQHVFFYSRDAGRLIAQRYGYEMVAGDDLMLFHRPGALSALRQRILPMLLSPRGARWLTSWAVTRANPGVWKDHVTIKQRLGRDDSRDTSGDNPSDSGR